MQQMCFQFSFEAAARKAAPQSPGKMVWDQETRRKLSALARQNPRPSNEVLARALGTTAKAVQTALSRFGITQGGVSSGAQPRDLSGVKERKCLRCREPFPQEHRHNFMCVGCNAEIAEMAA